MKWQNNAYYNYSVVEPAGCIEILESEKLWCEGTIFDTNLK